MSIRIMGASLFVLALFSGTGCNNTNCEQGAYCVDGEGTAKRDSGRECQMFCGRLAACGAPHADDFEACVADCDARFESTPEEAAVMCACAEWSSCDDIEHGRCSEPPRGSGGASGSGGSGGASGSGATGGASGSSGTGGTASVGGTGGTGAAGTNGASGTGAGGVGGTGAAGVGGTGAAGVGGTGAAGVGGTGGSGPIACGRDCDCPLPDVCVGGYCVAP
jgi:hypothetical protein